AGMQIALSAQGPKFRFIGGGRLAEIDDPPPESGANAPKPPSAAGPTSEPAGTEGKKSGGLFKKFFT
ncbi:MAG: hypothetical protein WAU91_13445, partial [Desulfatitalea sp.]